MQNWVKILIFNTISCGIIILLLWYIGIVDFWETLIGIPWYYYILFVVLYTVAFILRAKQWQFVFIGFNKKVKFSHIYYANGIAWLANDILPGRIGDLSRIEVITKSEQLPYGVSIGSYAILRLTDLIFFTIFSAAGLLYYTSTQMGILVSINDTMLIRQIYLGFGIALILIVGIVIGFVLIFKYPDRIIQLIHKISVKLGKLAEKLISPLKEALSQISQSPNKIRLYFSIIGSNFLALLCDGFLIVLLCMILDVQISYILAFSALFISFLIRIVPSTPGSWGVSEAVWAGLIFIFYPALTLEYLISIYLIDHLVRFVYTIIYGGFSIPRADYHWKVTPNPDSTTETSPKTKPY